MAVSAAAAVTAKPHLFHPTTKPTFSSLTFKPTSSSHSSCNGVSSNLPVGSISWCKRRIFDLVVGLSAASMVVATPLDANATRIEYYATVSDPPCEMTFAHSGLGYCDVAVGTGEEPPQGELIVIHYTARFNDGTVFDSSYKRARPLTLRIGVGKVIKGLDQGILGGEGVPPMLAGGKRKIQIPPELAYGPEPAGCFSGDCNIPANSTLVYDINYIAPYK